MDVDISVPAVIYDDIKVAPSLIDPALKVLHLGLAASHSFNIQLLQLLRVEFDTLGIDLCKPNIANGEILAPTAKQE